MEERKIDQRRRLNALVGALIRLATGRRILVLLALFLAYIVAVMRPAYRRIGTLSGGAGAIDFLIVYSPEQVYDMIAAYGEHGRAFYATIALTLDTIFPIALASVSCLVLTYLFHRAFSREDVLRRALLVPAVAMCADLLENVGIVTMLLTYPERLPTVALLASTFSTVKWTAVLAEVILVIIGLVSWVIQQRSRGDRTI